VELLDAKDVSKILKCSLPLVYKMADRGQLRCVRWECPGEGKERLRTTVRFKLSDVQAFIERHYATT
jgi:predicted DNA-binding transcriptional regulator AlpA